MSSPLAIAVVTAVLKDLLNDGIINNDLSAHVGSVRVSALPPDRIETGSAEPNQLNLFLHQVSPNPAWRNADLPSRNGDGKTRLSNPPLALDLHYLLTAYGRDELNAEILLGYAMHTLHENPVLTRANITKTLTNPSNVTDVLLPASVKNRTALDLAEQVELVKLSLQPVNTEEMSKLWSALQARYRPSAAYVASVVLIQATEPLRPALPVARPVVTVVQFRTPHLVSVEPQTVKSGALLMLRGFNLKATATRVHIDGAPAPAVVESDVAIKVTVPASLAVGMHAVQVIHEVVLAGPPRLAPPPGEPQPPALPPIPHPRAGFESNALAFMLAPSITSVAPASVATGSVLTVKVTPGIAAKQTVILRIGDAPPLTPDDVPGPNPTTLEFTIPAGFPTGEGLVRLNVDGVESVPEIDRNKASATYGLLTGLKVTVT